MGVIAVSVKKIAVLLTSAVLSAAGFTFSANAEKEQTPKIYLQCGYAQENSETVVSLMSDSALSVSAFSIEIVFDPSVLTFEDAVAGEALTSGTFYSNGEYSEDCVRLVWSDSKNADAMGELAKLKFSVKNATSGEKTGLYIGYTEMGNEKLQEVAFEKSDAEMEIKQDYVWGDANCDGYTTASDVVMINKYNLSQKDYPLSDNGFINADVDFNEIINLSDSMEITSYVLGISDKEGQAG